MGGYGNLQFSLENGIYQTNAVFDQLESGTYSVQIRDNEQCVLETEIKLAQPESLIADWDITEPACAQSKDGSVFTTFTGGTEPYTSIWTNSDGEITEPTSLGIGTYSMLVSDYNQCLLDEQITLNAGACQPQIDVPNVFSPNNDRLNDFLYVDAQHLANYRLEIFNRWGHQVFVLDQNNLYWNGYIMHTEREAATGVYFYVLTAFDFDGVRLIKKGNIHLFR